MDPRYNIGGCTVKILYLIFGGAALSFAFCWLVRMLPLRDAPDGGRKQQAAPVPTAGGLGIVLSIAVLLGYYASRPDALPDDHISAVGYTAIIALVLAPWVIGFIDVWLRGRSRRHRKALFQAGWVVFLLVLELSSG